MNKLKNIGVFAPIISAVVLIGCVTVSALDYEQPVYIVEQPEVPTELPEEYLAEEKPEPTEKKEENKEEKELELTPLPVTKQTSAAVKSSGDEDNVAVDFTKLADGSYEGSGTGFAGKIKVLVEIKEKRIVAIQILNVEADGGGYIEMAKAVIDRIIASQTLDVDTVSGATYSSRGIIRAVKNALTGETDDGQTAPAGTSTGVGMGTTSLPPATDAKAYKDGVYEGTGTGFAGDIKVEVTIKGGKITKIEIISCIDGTEYVEKAKGVISSIISNQSTNVDTVSGATYSSVGIIAAVRDALSKAATDEKTGDSEKQEEEKQKTGTVPYKDGVYYGTGDGFSGEIEVGVSIADKTIKSIVVTKTEDDEAFFNKAKKVIEKVLKKQSTKKVDTISGATFSSQGILDAIDDALANAKRITNGEAADTENAENTENTGNTENSENTESTGNTENTNNSENTETPGNTEAGSTESGGMTESTEATPSTLYKDGTYSVKVLCLADENDEFIAYNIYVVVTIAGDKITNIEVQGEDASNASYVKRAATGTSKIKGVVTQVIEKNNADNIDAVSGATCSSEAIIDACKQALLQAQN